MNEEYCGKSIYNPDKTGKIIVECEIILSERAVIELKRIIESVAHDNPLHLYLSVMGGGCSGYIYELDLEEDEPTKNHQVILQDGISVVIQDADSSMLNGLLLDYEDKLMGGGFKMINPNATKTCGCGLSFK
ncbi:iron-sulfur cluster assembly accessory protein [archaeon]|nr:iron-sulfur cluster assembly accessory protein [archaeon]|tara:strand:+ start:736 stop:1131 length:396 start_codon:yes stop_codon:yes gene_type:complete